MKQPVHPDVLKSKQYRNKYILGALFSVLGIVAIAGVFSLVLWLTWGHGPALAMVAIVGSAVTLLVGGLCIGGLIDNCIQAVDEHNAFRYMLNQHAWNTQQEELARLQRIMKEEQL